MMQALDAGAEDFLVHDDIYEIITSQGDFTDVCDTLEKQGLEFLGAEIQRIPQNTCDIDEELAETINKMLDMMEDDDDVQNVYHNGEFI